MGISDDPIIFDTAVTLAASGVVGGVRSLAATTSQSTRMAGVRAAGQIGEDLAGIVKNAERIPSLTGTAAYRVPDILDDAAKVIGKVKNYNGKLSLTAQLRDDLAYASQKGYQMILKVSSGTTFSQPLQQVINSGAIKVVSF